MAVIDFALRLLVMMVLVVVAAPGRHPAARPEAEFCGYPNEFRGCPTWSPDRADASGARFAGRDP